jgi:hypothetical protein
VTCWDVGEGDVAFFLLLGLAAVLDKVGNGLAEEWVDSEENFELIL